LLLIGVVASGRVISAARAAEPPPFRTDAQGPFSADEQKKLKNKKTAHEVLQWFQLEEGKFPPAGSEHAISGELIRIDHLERRFHLRVDRNDSQDRGVWDLPVDAFLLPYASIHYHGSPAALEDVPLGTHLHGLFYMRAPDDLTPAPDGSNNRKTPEVDFRRCFALEDDFTRNLRRSETWKIESVDLETKKLTAQLERDGSPQGKPQIFDLTAATVVYEAPGFGTLESLKPGKTALLNLTWGTLYGPGRITEIYLDPTSRELAARRQMDRHRDDIRRRGLAGWIDSVDDEKETVTMTFFGNVDPKLFDELAVLPPSPPEGTVPAGIAPPGTTLAPDGKLLPRGGLAVCRECLMTYDPVNDRKGATILEIKKVPVEPGSSGVRMQVKVDMMLEGFRPRRVVRFYPPTWKVIALPREEQFFGRD
jgi:hypothetical protein